MGKTGIIMLVLGLVLGGTYIGLMPAAASGYGYMGYRGYHHGPSFWYFGGANTYYSRNVRGGSVSGTGFRGGGPGAGK